MILGLKPYLLLTLILGNSFFSPVICHENKAPKRIYQSLGSRHIPLYNKAKESSKIYNEDIIILDTNSRKVSIWKNGFVGVADIDCLIKTTKVKLDKRNDRRELRERINKLDTNFIDLAFKNCADSEGNDHKNTNGTGNVSDGSNEKGSNRESLKYSSMTGECTAFTASEDLGNQDKNTPGKILIRKDGEDPVIFLTFICIILTLISFVVPLCNCEFRLPELIPQKEIREHYVTPPSTGSYSGDSSTSDDVCSFDDCSYSCSFSDSD
jgi:hypothetical protein